MKKVFGSVLFIFLTSMLFAENVTCKNDNGSCEFKENGGYECLCSEDSYGEGTGVAGSGDSGGDVIMPTQEECLEMIDDMCALPEGAVTCENPAGECVVMEDGDYWCDCLDGSGTGGGDSEPGDPGEEPDEAPSIDPDEPEETDSGSNDSQDDPPSVDGENDTEPVKEECEKDADCQEGFFCKEGYCYDGYYEMEECEKDADCKEGFVCWDGYCYEKESEDPEKEKPECEALLKETCGTEAPDLKKICSEDALKFCADGMSIYYKKCEDKEISSEMIEEVQEGTWNEIAPDVVDCCNDYEYIEEEMATFIDCLKEKECEDCTEDFEEAVGEDYGDSGDPADSGNSGSANEDDTTGGEGNQESEEPKDSESDSSDGCSLTLI